MNDAVSQSKKASSTVYNHIQFLSLSIDGGLAMRPTQKVVSDLLYTSFKRFTYSTQAELNRVTRTCIFQILQDVCP